jgi:hypothetical protein
MVRLKPGTTMLSAKTSKDAGITAILTMYHVSC